MPRSGRIESRGRTPLRADDRDLMACERSVLGRIGLHVLDRSACPCQIGDLHGIARVVDVHHGDATVLRTQARVRRIEEAPAPDVRQAVVDENVPVEARPARSFWPTATMFQADPPFVPLLVLDDLESTKCCSFGSRSSFFDDAATAKAATTSATAEKPSASTSLRISLPSVDPHSARKRGSC